MATLGPGRTAIFMHLMPIFSVVLAVVFLGERLYAYHVIGALLIVSGITLVTRPRAVRPRPERLEGRVQDREISTTPIPATIAAAIVAGSGRRSVLST